MNIVVINPNSSEAMTADIRNAAERYAAGRFQVTVLPTPGAPEFIDTVEDRALAAPGMSAIVREYEDKADAFIVACHCDPNLQLLRELTSKPVLGIGEARSPSPVRPCPLSPPATAALRRSRSSSNSRSSATTRSTRCAM